MSRGWLRILPIVLVICSCGGHDGHDTPIPDAGPASVPLAHLLVWHRAGLYALGGLFGQAADGRVFGGDRLDERVPELDGAIGVTGGGSGISVLASPPDSWVCGLVRGGITCMGTNTGGELDPLPTQDCGNPSCGEWGCWGAPSSYRCVPNWSLLPTRGDVVQIHRTCALDKAGNVTCRKGPPPPFTTPIRRLVDDYAIASSGELLDATTGQPAGLSDVVDACGTRVVCPGGLCPNGNVCAVRSNGSLWCWGANDAGVVGDGTLDPREVPVRVGDGFVDVDCGLLATCAVRKDGTVACWGDIGDPDSPGSVPCMYGSRCVTTPTTIAGLTDVVEIAVDVEAYALRAGGSVVEVGFRSSGAPRRVIHP